MIELEIIGFRCYRHITLRIHEGEMTLLQGPSGIGKSTIMAAIGWCLFGNKIHRGVDTINSEDGKDKKATGKLCVTLKYNNHIIKRQKRPNAFTVLVAGIAGGVTQEYNSEDADAVVARLFCHHSLWNIVGHIPQNETHKLLSGSNSARMTYLNTLAFDDFDPTTQIATINNELQKTNVERQFLSTTLEREQKVLQNEALLHHGKKLISADTTLQLRNIIGELLHKQATLLEKKAQHDYSHSRLLQLQPELNKLLQQLQSLPTSDKITSETQSLIAKEQHLNQQLQNLLIIQAKLEEKSRIDQQNANLLRDYESCCTALKDSRFAVIQGRLTTALSDGHAVHKQLSQTMVLEEKYNRNKKLCDSFAIPYESSAIEKELTLVRRWHQLQPIRQMNNELMNHKQRLAQFQISGGPQSVTELMKQKAELEQQQATYLSIRNVKECPHCKGTVRVMPTGLIEKAPVPNGTELDKIDTHINNIIGKIRTVSTNCEISRQHESLLQCIAECEKKLQHMIASVGGEQDLSAPVASAPKIPEHILMNIEIISPPVPSSNDLHLMLEYHHLQNRANELSKYLSSIQPGSTINAVSVKPSVITSDINKLRNELSENKKQQMTLHDQRIILGKLDTQIALLQGEITKFNAMLDPTVGKQIEDCKNTITHNQKLISDSLDCETYNRKIDTYTTMLKQLTMLQSRYTKLLRMKEISVNCECAMLYEIVNSLNVAANNIAAYLFDSAITITLTLHKQLKTEDRKVQAVHVDINYKGMKLDSIAALSGGERDRISLCLTLAANSISGCPILLLDEMVSSLHEEGSTTAIKSIAKSSAGKTCLVIAHNAIEGHFRDVIDLRNYQQCFQQSHLS
jgi:ABC-type lipoprotein export system ATPase subunit